MTVYVDKMNAKYRGMIMCHMVADTEEELDEMAHKIGIQKKWKQTKSTLIHYDISLSKKRLAMKNGAIEIDKKQLVDFIRKTRNANERCKGEI